MTTQARERHRAPATVGRSTAPRRCWTTDRLAKLRASPEVEEFPAIHPPVIELVRPVVRVLERLRSWRQTRPSPPIWKPSIAR